MKSWPLLGALFPEPPTDAPASPLSLSKGTPDAPKSNEASDSGNSSFADEMLMALAGRQAEIPVTQFPKVEVQAEAEAEGAAPSTPMSQVSKRPATPRPISVAPPFTQAVTENPGLPPVKSSGLTQMLSVLSVLPGVIQPASKPPLDEAEDALVESGQSEPAIPPEIKVSTVALAEWIGLHSMSAPFESRAPEMSNPSSNSQTTCRVLEAGDSNERAGEDSNAILPGPPIARAAEKSDPTGIKVTDPRAEIAPDPTLVSLRADLSPLRSAEKSGVRPSSGAAISARQDAPEVIERLRTPFVASLEDGRTPPLNTDEPKLRLQESQLDSQVIREELPVPVSEKVQRREAAAERSPESLDALQTSPVRFMPPPRAVRDLSQTSEAQSPTAPGGMSRAEPSPWMNNAPESGRNRPWSGQELPRGGRELPRGDGMFTPAPMAPQQLPVDARLTPSPIESSEIAGVLSSRAALQSADRMAPAVDAPSASADGSGIQIIQELRAAIPAHAVELKQSKSEAMTVVLRPDSETTLQLQLSGRDGQVDVRAQLEQGNFHALNAHWGGLQQALSSQGISLGALQESGVGSFVGGESSDAFRRAQQEMENADLELVEQQALRRPSLQDSSGHPQSRPASSSRTWESWA